VNFGDVVARGDNSNRYVLVLSNARFITSYGSALVTPVFRVPEGNKVDIEALTIALPFHGYLIPRLMRSVPIGTLGAVVGTIDEDDVYIVMDVFADALQPE
jgi:mRNA-degrading endonuclease toxin of MazEF toxin-antitoxin module